MRGIDWGPSQRGRHLRLGRVVVEVARQTHHGDPRLDGATLHFQRWREGDPDRAPVLEADLRAGGVAVKLTDEKRHRAGWRLTVGVIGWRCWQPHRTLLTRRGRAYRRAARDWPMAATGRDNTPMAPTAQPDDQASWPFV